MNEPIYRLAAVALAVAAVLSGLSALALLAAPLPPRLALLAWCAAVLLVPLLAAAAVFARQALQEARWNGVLPSRQNSWK